MLDLIENLLGNQNTAGLGHGLKPRGEVDALAQQIVAIDHHVAEMDADPEAQRAFRVAAAPTKFALHLDRALHGLDHRGELGDQSVARGVDDAAVVTFDELGENPPRGAQGSEPADLVSVHHAAVAFGVGREDRRQLSPHLGGHGRARRWDRTIRR